MHVAPAHVESPLAMTVLTADRSSEIAEAERLQSQDMQRRDDLVVASRSPEQAIGQIIDEIV